MSGKQWSTKLKVSAAERGILIQEKAVLELQACIHPTNEKAKCEHALTARYRHLNKNIRDGKSYENSMWEIYGKIYGLNSLRT